MYNQHNWSNKYADTDISVIGKYWPIDICMYVMTYDEPRYDVFEF